jgi:hypothetical protein
VIDCGVSIRGTFIFAAAIAFARHVIRRGNDNALERLWVLLVRGRGIGVAFGQAETGMAHQGQGQADVQQRSLADLVRAVDSTNIHRSPQYM